MKIIRDIEQGSPEWHQLRLGIPTASNFDKIITSTGELSATLPKYALELASQYLILEPEIGYCNEAMLRGKELEPLARQAYQEAVFEKVEEVAFIRCDDYGYSPDGLVGDDGLIEIKCPNQTTHTKYLLDNKLPIDYKAQVQGGLLASGREWCDFVSFHPNFKDDKKLFIVRVFRDDSFISKLEIALKEVLSKRNEILEKLNLVK